MSLDVARLSSGNPLQDRELRRRFDVSLDELAFAVRMRREPALAATVETWLEGAAVETGGRAAWVEWEQRKHERLLAA